MFESSYRDKAHPYQSDVSLRVWRWNFETLKTRSRGVLQYDNLGCGVRMTSRRGTVSTGFHSTISGIDGGVAGTGQRPLEVAGICLLISYLHMFDGCHESDTQYIVL